MNSKTKTIRLKIPPAFEPDVWICNHSGKKSIQNSASSQKKTRFLSMKEFDKQMNRKFEQMKMARRKNLESPYSKSLLLSEYNNLKHLVTKKHKFKKKNKTFVKLITFCKKKYRYRKKFKFIKKLGSNTRVKVNQYVNTRKKNERKKFSFVNLFRKKKNFRNYKKMDDNIGILDESLVSQGDILNLSPILIPTLNQKG